MTDTNCDHRTARIEYRIERCQLEVRCDDCEKLLAYLTDEELTRTTDLNLTVTIFANNIGVRREVVVAALNNR